MASHGVRFKWARNVEDEAVSDRVIFLDRSTDSAVVLFLKGDLQLPELPIALLPAGEACGIGTDIGWLGYPAIEPNTLCFFAGVVSARLEATKSYLVDGVSIHGISGGPVFHCPSPTSNGLVLPREAD